MDFLKIKNLYFIIFLLLVIFISSICATKIVNAQDLWWFPEYQKLITKIKGTQTKKLTTSWRTGPGGKGTVHLSISIKKNSVVLEQKLPRQAIVTYDEKTGKMVPSKKRPVVIIRDHDLEGYPDDFLIEPGKPLENAILTIDGFVKYQNSE